MCYYLGGGLHGRQKRVKAQSESSKSVVNSVLISREMPVFPGFFEIIRVVRKIICIVGLCLHFSRLICTTDAQILLYIAKEKGIESVDGLTLTDIIISDDKTNALVICELGQPYVSRIFAWKFNVIASNLFIPSRGYTQNDEPWPIKTYIWDSKYIVIINDLSAKSYSVILDGQKKIEKIENYPTILQFPLATTSNLVFYDEDQNIIN